MGFAWWGGRDGAVDGLEMDGLDIFMSMVRECELTYVVGGTELELGEARCCG